MMGQTVMDGSISIETCSVCPDIFGNKLIVILPFKTIDLR